MAQLEYIIGLPVKQYLRKSIEKEFRAEDAFDRAPEDTAGAIQVSKRNIRDELGVTRLPNGLSFHAEFDFFDSTNISHAAAVWKITVDGTSSIISKIKDYLDLQ